MTPLPFAVMQFPHPALKRAVQAHVVRGLSHWLNTLDTSGSHPLNLLYVLNLHPQVKMEYSTRVDVGVAVHVLKQLTIEIEPWDAPSRLTNLVWALSVLKRYCADQQEFEAVLAKAYFYHHCVYHRQRETRNFDMKEDDASRIPQDVYNRLNSVLLDLETTLVAKDPMMPQHLRTIHGMIMAYPESTHLLKDTEIALIIQGAQEHTKVQIVSEAAKKATVSRTKSLKNVNIADL